MEDELLRQLEEDVTEFLMTSSLNYVSKQMAVEPQDIGMRLYDAPIFGVGSAEAQQPSVLRHSSRRMSSEIP